MLFLNVKKYGWDAHVFGDKNERHGGVIDRTRLNEHYSCRLLRYNSLPRMYGNDFDSVSISGKVLVGHLECPYWALSHNNNVPHEATLPSLILAYVRHKVETPFETWLAQNPLLPRRRERTHMGVFWTYDGEVWLTYLQEGKLHWEAITEPTFVSEGFLTTVEEAMAQQMKSLRQKITEAEDIHQKLKDVPFDYPQVLNRSGLTNFVRSF